MSPEQLRTLEQELQKAQSSAEHHASRSVALADEVARLSKENAQLKAELGLSERSHEPSASNEDSNGKRPIRRKAVPQDQ